MQAEFVGSSMHGGTDWMWVLQLFVLSEVQLSLPSVVPPYVVNSSRLHVAMTHFSASGCKNLNRNYL